MRDNNPFLSIVIPVYNVEKYLARCLDSILFQITTYKYEIIAIDDCSTDSSASILETYKDKFEHFKIIKHQNNKSLSAARKTGICASSGEYIMHVDSDDWISYNSLQKLCNIINEVNTDIIVFNYFISDSSNIENEIRIIDKKKNFESVDTLHDLFLGAPWNKIVKRDLLINTIYGDIGINNGEDLVYSSEIFFKANSIEINKFSFYVYFKNPTSLTRLPDSYKFLSNQVNVLYQLTHIFNKYLPSDYQIAFILKYFLKFIHLEIFNYHFYEKKCNRQPILNLFHVISSNVFLTKYFPGQINNSIQHKSKSFFYIIKYWGIKKAMILYFKSIFYAK